eukprot:7314143-Alexandrium_andersonii.AAC.1
MALAVQLCASVGSRAQQRFKLLGTGSWRFLQSPQWSENFPASPRPYGPLSCPHLGAAAPPQNPSG